MTVLRLCVGVVLLGLLAACAHAAPEAEAAPRYWLLGEVHDNAEGHRLRHDWLRERVEAGWRPTVVMEMFDREHQPALERALRTCGDADCVIRAAGGEGAGWQWPLYVPVIDLALQYRLPVVAANISRAELGRMMREGLPAALGEATIARFGLDAPLPEAVLAPQLEAVRIGHCDMLPEPMLAPMATAQIARDVWMAQALLQAPGDAVLLAGNGHVREDVGAPWWLRHAGVRDYRTLGWVEPGTASSGLADARVVPAQPREDPCERFRRSR